MQEIGKPGISESGHRLPARVLCEDIPSSENTYLDDDLESLDEEGLIAIAEAASVIEMLKRYSDKTRLDCHPNCPKRVKAEV